MIQTLLPIFSEEATLVNSIVGYQKRSGKVYYFLGQAVIFSHNENDMKSFRYITCQLVANGNVTQSEIIKAFGISKISMKRYMKIFREKDWKGIFERRRGRGAHVLTKEVLNKVQQELDQDKKISAIGKELKIKTDTIQKAIKSGRLKKNKI